jgi:hypothetical protein
MGIRALLAIAVMVSIDNEERMTKTKAAITMLRLVYAL